MINEQIDTRIKTALARLDGRDYHKTYIKLMERFYPQGPDSEDIPPEHRLDWYLAIKYLAFEGYKKAREEGNYTKMEKCRHRTRKAYLKASELERELLGDGFEVDFQV